MRNKEQLRNCSRLKQTQETWQLKTICNPGFDSEPKKKGIRGTVGKI